MKGAHGAGQKTSGDKNDEHAGPAKEDLKVQPDAAAIHRDPECESAENSKCRTDRDPDADVLLHGRDQKKHRLKTLTTHRKKRRHRQREAARVT